MGAGMEIKAYGNNIHVTPTDEEERETLITMYTRVNIDPKVIGNAYIFTRENWHKIIKASMER
jgi:hypothetical protein